MLYGFSLISTRPWRWWLWNATGIMEPPKGYEIATMGVAPGATLAAHQEAI
jgi:hypothetical protein